MDEKTELSAEVIYQTLQANLNRELSNFWQRALFVWSFLLLAYTGYGTLMLKIGTDDVLWGNARVHIMAGAVAVFGIFFSYLWILMAKAAKAWYEVHEAIINDFGRCYLHKDKNGYFSSRTAESEKNLDKSPVDDKVNDWKQRLAIYVGFDYCRSEVLKAKRDPTNDSCFSLFAGDYSPSRIGIFCGIFSFLLWDFVALTHCVLIVTSIFESQSWISCSGRIILSIVILVASVYAGLMIISYLRKRSCRMFTTFPNRLKSSFLSDFHSGSSKSKEKQK